MERVEPAVVEVPALARAANLDHVSSALHYAGSGRSGSLTGMGEGRSVGAMAKRPAWTRRGFLSAAASAGAVVSAGAWPARASGTEAPGGAAAPDPGLISGIVRPFPSGAGPPRARSLPRRARSKLPLSAVDARRPAAAHLPPQRGHPVIRRAARRLGEAGLRAARALHGRPLSFGLRADLRGAPATRRSGRRANAMVAELAKCQKAHGSGYLSALSRGAVRPAAQRRKVWAPFYTYTRSWPAISTCISHCGNEQALAMAEGMAAWVRNWTQGPLRRAHGADPAIEFGGMNDVLYDLSRVTGKEEYRELAHRFDQKRLLRPARRAARRADGPARQHAVSEGHRRRPALRADGRAALSRHR